MVQKLSRTCTRCSACLSPVMEALLACSAPSPRHNHHHQHLRTQTTHPHSRITQLTIPSFPSLRPIGPVPRPSKLCTALSPSAIETSAEAPETEASVEEGEKFDWHAQWYPVMPVCDLDKRRPLAKRVMGIDVVVWWDRHEAAWKVMDDTCPHRLAPLSEGRIDQWGRLQCVYHGWCFDGSGNCKLIPQAAREGPPVIILSFCRNSTNFLSEIPNKSLVSRHIHSSRSFTTTTYSC